MTRKLESLARKLTDLDLAIPDDAEALLALRAAVTEASLALNPLATLEDDIAAGNITAADAADRIHKAAAALAAKEKATQVAQQLEPLLDRQGARWMVANGDDLIDLLRPTFDQAINDMRGIVDTLGPTPNDQAVLAAGPAAATAWQHRMTTIRRLDHIVRCVMILEDAGYRTFDRVPGARYVTDVPDADTLDNLHKYIGGAHFGEGIAAGLTYRLNTTAEAEAVIAQARAVTAAEHAAAQAQRDALIEQRRQAREVERAEDIAAIKRLTKARR